MWIVNGPTSIVPLEGEGMFASKVTGQKILPTPAGACLLEENPQRQVGRTAPLDEVDREVEVDVEPSRQLRRSPRAVAGELELLGPPGLYQVGLLANHQLDSHLAYLFGRRGRPVHA
jgi:hypothetical protein